jgi:hypothetical protein
VGVECIGENLSAASGIGRLGHVRSP